MAIIVKAHKNDHISYENPILNLVLYVIQLSGQLVNDKKWLVNDHKAAVKNNRQERKRAKSGLQVDHPFQLGEELVLFTGRDRDVFLVAHDHGGA